MSARVGRIANNEAGPLVMTAASLPLSVTRINNQGVQPRFIFEGLLLTMDSAV